MKQLMYEKKGQKIVLDKMSKEKTAAIAGSFMSFLDTASTATARATYYNTKAEQEKAVLKTHQNLLDIDRGLYGLSLLMPGLTDYNKQTAIRMFLSNPYNSGLLTAAQENILIEKLTCELPVPRMLKVFVELKEKRINNARTRKLILKQILGSDKLPFWAVKYRTKLNEALEHAWGKRKTSIVASILAKAASVRNEKELAIIRVTILEYANPKVVKDEILESVSFILGDESKLTNEYLLAYVEAKKDLSKGKILPYEVLEGIRSTYHQDKSNKEVLELTKSQLTKSQQLTFQRKAEEAKVKVDFNPLDFDAVKLYIYAFERGINEEILNALHTKAKETAKKLALEYNKIGLLVDNSASMFGNESQKLRPMAIALSVRDVLQAASKECTVKFINELKLDHSGLIVPEGDTSLAEQFMNLVEEKPEAIFIISDGYENATSGRLAEVLRLLRKIGNDTVVFQVAPVMASEASGVRKLSPKAGILAVSDPGAIGLSMIRGLFMVDLEQAINRLLEHTLPKLTS